MEVISRLTPVGPHDHASGKGFGQSSDAEGKAQAPLQAPSLHGVFLSEVVRAAMAGPGIKEKHVQPLNLQNQVDEAFGVDKLRQDNVVLQKRLAQSREQASSLELEVASLEREVQRLETVLHQAEQGDTDQILRNLRWRQMGAICDDMRETRKRPELPWEGTPPPLPPSQRMAIEVHGRPQASLTNESRQDPVDRQWEEYTQSQEKLSFLQQEFNTVFTSLSSQKRLVNARHERLLGALSKQVKGITLDGHDPSAIRAWPDESAGDVSAQDDSSQADSDSIIYQSRDPTATGIGLASNSVSPEHSGRDSTPDAERQDLETSSLCEMTPKTLRTSQGLQAEPPETPFTLPNRDSDQPSTLQSRPSIVIRSDTPRELSPEDAPSKADKHYSCPTRIQPIGTNMTYATYPWKWQIDGALSEAAQDLMKTRSLQMEGERRRLWEAAGADPEALKLRLKELSERESALASKAMHLEAAKSYIAESQRMSDVALSRSIALDRREADLKTRESQVAHNASRYLAREEEIKSLKKRISDLEYLVREAGISVENPKISTSPEQR